MDSQKNLAIEILKEEEAWKLFKKVATDIVLSPDLQSTAIEVAKKCAGLPIAIVTVGKAMKNKKNLFEWKNALQELRRPSKRNFKGIPAGVYSAIELSYKFLEAEEHQPTFLLCSIMGHDAAIEDLLEYGMGLGLFHGVNTIEETRYKVSTLVSNLKASSLLLDGSTIDHFDMHDVVHDVAMSIAARDHHWLALGRDDVFKELSDGETMRNYSLISLKSTEVSELLDHDQLDCPNLSFFSLESEDSSLKISNNFFKGMQKLKVLDFANIHFSSLPSSFCFLKNIRTLRLFNCMLTDIVIIGELKNLEILSLRESVIAVLPYEIGQLTKLKLLDLSDCYPPLEVIAPDVLSRLSKLEELYLYHSFDGWEVEGHEKPKANVSLVELQHLSHLTTLEIHIPDEQALPKELSFENLERYKISIGETWWRYEKLETSRNLKLKLNNKNIHLYGIGVKTLLRKTETLVLDAVKDAMDMLYDSNTEGSSHLKHLHVYNVLEVEHIINSMKLVSCKAFPLLESLILRNLINLKAICYGQLKAEYFGQLRIIKVEECNMLKNLFPLATARELSQLQEIEVSYCKNLIELIVMKREEEIGDDNILEFSQFHSLKLQELPSLTCLFYSEKKFSSSQQRSVQSIDKRSTVTSLFHQKVVFKGIKELILDSIPIEKLWYDQPTVMSFEVQNLKSLEVYRCHNLKNLFTSSIVKSFEQLKTLVVECCDNIEEVITVTEGLVEDERNKKMIFPKLVYLEFNNLPNLKRFSSGNPIEFPFLMELKMVECPVLDTFHYDSTSVGTVVENEVRRSISMENLWVEIPKYLFNEKVVFTDIKELILDSISIEKLWHGQLTVISFGVQNLTSLKVFRCHNLKNLFTSSMVKSFVQLKTLVVECCDNIEEVITVTEGLVEDERNRKMVFPELEYLDLNDLPYLKRFSSENPIEFPFLRELRMVRCPVLDTFHCDSTSVGTTVKNEAGKSNISMEDLFVEIPKYLFNEKVALPMLEHLYVDGLENLKRVWSNQLAENSFSKLISFELEECDKLLSVFSLSMVTRLQRLDRLLIRYCDLLEEIFESQEEGSSSATQSLSSKLIQSSLAQEKYITFELPQLTFLALRSLPNLKSFFLKIHTTSWPSLKKMSVKECHKVEIFASENLSFCDIDRMDQQEILIQQPLFWINKSTFPNLEELTLELNGGMKEILHGRLLPRLTELRLIGLQELMHLWKEKEGFQNLRELYVIGCPKLKSNLVPSSVCFQNLMTLEVYSCEGIIKLVTHSTAKSLVQLRKMKICVCQNIEEIIEGSDGDHDEVKDEISFPQLTLLELVMLPKLESFCSSENHTFEFPSLATVVVEHCPKMKMFSQGALNAPILHEVRLDTSESEMDWIWDGNLNSSIQQLLKKRNPIEEMQNSMEDQGSSSISSTQPT